MEKKITSRIYKRELWVRRKIEHGKIIVPSRLFLCANITQRTFGTWQD